MVRCTSMEETRFRSVAGFMRHLVARVQQSLLSSSQQRRVVDEGSVARRVLHVHLHADGAGAVVVDAGETAEHTAVTIAHHRAHPGKARRLERDHVASRTATDDVLVEAVAGAQIIEAEKAHGDGPRLAARGLDATGRVARTTVKNQRRSLFQKRRLPCVESTAEIVPTAA